MNQQREVIYSLRSFALEGGEELKGEARRWSSARSRAWSWLGDERAGGLGRRAAAQDLLMQYLLTVPCVRADGEPLPPDGRRGVAAAVRWRGAGAFHAKQSRLRRDSRMRLLSLVMLNVLDEKWKDHLYDLDQLRGAIHYRSWGQKDPLVEYKQEAFSMFEDLMRDIQHTFAERFLKVQIVFEEPRRLRRNDSEREAGTGDVGGPWSSGPASRDRSPGGVGGTVAGGLPPGTISRKVGRNDACPCGSGKKFKKCHGATL
jgi:preprotein translocase subunit SecA